MEIENWFSSHRTSDFGLRTSDSPLLLIAGPCVIESAEQCLRIAEFARGVAERLGVTYVFKASFDKANRSSAASFRGPGMEAGLKILSDVRRKVGVPVLSDVHEVAQCRPAGEVLDILQIPAFLCRQTDLIAAAAATGKALNIKKGQFMSPAEMGNAVAKAREAGNTRAMLTERGTFFGYNSLVNDMTGLAVMAGFGCPVIFDATHSTQRPGGQGDKSGGRPEFAPLLARAAVAAGADGLFLEIHPEPRKALSDAATMLGLDELEPILRSCVAIRRALTGG
jgi:2-dehydro-3-deoxyphosphooctonate aldolase (KDO 8-P synthase)